MLIIAPFLYRWTWNIQVASRLQFRSRELASPNPEEILTVFLWRHLDLLPDEVILLISRLQSITIKDDSGTEHLAAAWSCLASLGMGLENQHQVGYNTGGRWRTTSSVSMPIRIYFEQFCPVEGVLYLPNRGNLRRVVIAFPWWIIVCSEINVNQQQICFLAQKWSRPCLLWRPENLIRLSART